jgi:cytoskeletal protein RodZ
MKSLPRPTHLKRNVLLAIIVVLVAAGSAFAYSQYNKPTSTKTNTDTSSSQKDTSDNTDTPATTEQQQAGEDQKQATVDQDQDQSTTPTSTFGVTITAANQNGSVLNVRSLINKVANSGVCTLTLTKGTATITKQANIQALAESSTCKGFDVPTSELSKGTWHIVLSVAIGSAQGKAQQDIVVN